MEYRRKILAKGCAAVVRFLAMDRLLEAAKICLLATAPLLSIIPTSVLALGDSGSVTLVRKLGPSENPELNQSTKISKQTFREQLRASLWDLRLDRYTQRPFRGYNADITNAPYSTLSDEDKMTLLETQLNLLLRSRYAPSPCREMTEQDPLNTGNAFRITNAFRNNIEKQLNSDVPKVMYSDHAKTAVRSLDLLIEPKWLLGRIEELSRSDAHGPAFWQPALDQCYELLRRRLIELDFEIKIVANTDSESADLLSAETMAVLESIDPERNGQILPKLFAKLQDDFYLNVRANRMFTKAVDWIHERIETPARIWSFRVAILSAITALGGSAIGAEGLSQHAWEVSAISGAVWFNLLVEHYVYRGFITGASRLLDQVKNLTGSLIFRNRKGPMSNSIQNYLEGLDALRCEDLLSSSH